MTGVDVGRIKSSIIIVLALFAMMISPKTFAVEQILDVMLPSSSFLDVPDNYWAYTEISELHHKGILKGYPSQKFCPEAFITREEFATAVIKALGLNDGEVMDPLVLDDVFPEDWAYQNIQNAFFFGLFLPPRMAKDGGYYFYPTQNITRAHAITMAVNSIKTVPMTKKKAKSVLEYTYDDFFKIPDWFVAPAAKAQILDMLVIDPRGKKEIAYDKPITRAETAVLLYNMIEEARKNPNDKIKAAFEKKISAEGHVIQDAIVDDSIATIPAGTELPLVITGKISSQKACEGEKYVALVPKNFVTAKKYLLIPYGARFTGHVQQVKKGRFLIRNAVLTLQNDSLDVLHQPLTRVNAIAEIKTPKSDSRFRKIFKGEKLTVDRGEFLYIKLLEPIKVDVSTGRLLVNPELDYKNNSVMDPYQHKNEATKKQVLDYIKSPTEVEDL